MDLPDTRASLIAKLADAQDLTAWTDFCAIYNRAIFQIARRHGLQEADALEVCQEVLLRVSAKARQFDSTAQGSFRSWLAVVARNATIDLLRKRKPFVGGSEIADRLGRIEAGGDLSSIEMFSDCERQAELHFAMQQVRQSCTHQNWQAFWLTAVDGLSGKQVADRLGMSIGAIYVARCRVVSKIKACIETIRGDAQ